MIIHDTNALVEAKVSTNFERLCSDFPVSASLTDGALAEALGFSEAVLQIAAASANAKLVAGDMKSAMSTYAMLVLCAPLNIEYQCGLAASALQEQKFEVVIRSASMVIAHSPSDYRGYYLSGLACFGLGHVKEAHEDIEQAHEFASRKGNSIVTDHCKMLISHFGSLTNDAINCE